MQQQSQVYGASSQQLEWTKGKAQQCKLQSFRVLLFVISDESVEYLKAIVLNDTILNINSSDTEAVSKQVTDDATIIKQYCNLICQICGDGEDLLNKSWRTKVNFLLYHLACT
jgi:hypothetical protein